MLHSFVVASMSKLGCSSRLTPHLEGLRCTSLGSTSDRQLKLRAENLLQRFWPMIFNQEFAPSFNISSIRRNFGETPFQRFLSCCKSILPTVCHWDCNCGGRGSFHHPMDLQCQFRQSCGQKQWVLGYVSLCRLTVLVHLIQLKSMQNTCLINVEKCCLTSGSWITPADYSRVPHLLLLLMIPEGFFPAHQAEAKVKAKRQSLKPRVQKIQFCLYLFMFHCFSITFVMLMRLYALHKPEGPSLKYISTRRRGRGAHRRSKAQTCWARRSCTWCSLKRGSCRDWSCCVWPSLKAKALRFTQLKSSDGIRRNKTRSESPDVHKESQNHRDWKKRKVYESSSKPKLWKMIKQLIKQYQADFTWTIRLLFGCAVWSLWFTEAVTLICTAAAMPLAASSYACFVKAWKRQMDGQKGPSGEMQRYAEMRHVSPRKLISLLHED